MKKLKKLSWVFLFFGMAASVFAFEDSTEAEVPAESSESNLGSKSELGQEMDPELEAEVESEDASELEMESELEEGLYSEPESNLETEPEVAYDCTIDVISDYVDDYLVRMEKAVPSMVALNQDYNVNYIIISKDKLKKVVIEDQLPDDVEYISSNPTAEVDGDKIIWTLYDLEEGEIVPLELVLSASAVSDFSTCATVVAHPAACLTTTVSEPVLLLQNSIPFESVMIGSDIVFDMTIANIGNFCAEDVVITDILPEGLVHTDDESEKVIEIGTLVPGESRDVFIRTTSTEPGEQCYVAVANASNAESVRDEACVNILQSGLTIDVEGPDTQFAGKKATYDITVANVGDIPLENIVVVNKVPPKGRLLNAEGATVNGNTATWAVSIPAHEEKSFEVDLTFDRDGTHCNEVSYYTIDASLNGSDTACTEWRGYPALLIEVLDTQDPLLVGEETTYIIQIANQGTAADTNVILNIQIPEGLKIESAEGDTEVTVDGNNISFAPYPKLNAKEIIEFRVVAKAVDIGDMRFKAQMSSDLLKSPVPEEESTQAY